MAPKIALCMIVRDSAKTIDALLASILEKGKCPFDELVFVDTGSTDATRVRIMSAVGFLRARLVSPMHAFIAHEGLPAGVTVWPTVGEPAVVLPAIGVCPRVVFASFKWVDDFSAARQFSFELATATWRGYLDCDDIADELVTKNFRSMVESTEKDHPESNCISLKYEYVPSEMPQDKIRFVLWAAGWQWEDPVHEHLLPVGHPRAISKYEDVWIRHRPADPQKHANAAFARNHAILERAYAVETRPVKKALWAYYLGRHAAQLDRPDDVRRFFREAVDGLGRNNLACEALVNWSRMECRLGDIDKAIALAAEAIGRAPELPDGFAALAVAQTQLGVDVRAAVVFDMLRAQPTPVFESTHDAVFLDGVARCHAALAYYRLGRIADAVQVLSEVPPNLRQHPEVHAAGRAPAVALSKTDGFNRLRALWEYLIWDTEPIKAKRLLEEFVPAAISDSPQVALLREQMDAKLKHMEGWNAYRRAYANIPNLPYHVPLEDHAWTLTQARSRMVAQWARSQPKEGRPLHVLSIGVQDGIIEGAMLTENPRIHLTVCDVAPQASVGITALEEAFPGRVVRHVICRDHYDWFPATVAPFDAVFLFEVLEHLPDDVHAINTIRTHLVDGGLLFLSTPIASDWVEPYLSNLSDPRPWWHVRAHNPTTLWNLLYTAGFTGSLFGVSAERLFLGSFEKRALPEWPPLEIAIYVYPLRAVGGEFDPFSPRRGHVGGSEEAVIHLSAALARKGVRVTVYTDMPQRQDQTFVFNGVQWRPHAEFCPEAMRGTVLVWRSPVYARDIKRRNPKLRVLNWLHDHTSGCSSEVYEGADGTIALSNFHAASIRECDKYDGPLLFAANGIDPAEFPMWPGGEKVPVSIKDNDTIEGVIVPGRDPHAAIYAAAPNRGLEHLLAAWPQIRAAVPDATLRIYYSWELTEKLIQRSEKHAELLGPLLVKLKAQLETLKDKGVTYVGGVHHAVLHEAYRTSGVWTYPPIAFDEIYCISALKAAASGCWPVIVPTGALPETCPHGDHVRSHSVDDYAQAVIARMNNPPSNEERTSIRRWALTNTWESAAETFIDLARRSNKRITIFAGAFGRPFDGRGSADGAPLGGSEEAVIALAHALEMENREVVVYCPLPAKEARADGTRVLWRDSSTFDPRGPHGTLLAWRCPHLMDKLGGNGYPVILWLMDPEYNNMGAGGYDYEAADRVVFLTETHREIIQRRDGYVGRDNDAIVHVGLPHLPASLFAPNREARWVMWATSPDRGLLEFLKLWRSVVVHVPDAQLHIFYGLEPLIRAGKHELVAAIQAELEQPGVVYHGGVPDAELITWYTRCSLFVYRSIGFEETQSIATVKAMALGCWPLVNNAGALFEVIRRGGGGSVTERSDDATYGPYLVDMLKDPPRDERRATMMRTTREAFSGEAMADKMLDVIDKLLGGDTQ